MTSKVLVSYASRYGSTGEVAQVVAAELGGCGVEVEAKPMREVRDLTGYRAVVLGAPLYFGALHKEALDFLAQQAEALRKLPVAFFALGPLHNDDQERRDGRAAVDGQLAKFGWLSPVACEVFGGMYDPAKLGLGHRLIAALPASPLHGMPAADARDWEAIRAWAGSLVSALEPATA